MEWHRSNRWMRSSYRLLFTYWSTYSWFRIMTPEAEKFNGWMAMIGFVAALGAYLTTGQIIPGIL